MNKTIKGLLIAALALSAQNVSGASTNKTFLQPRNQGLVNLPLEMTTFHERTSAKIANRWGFNFEATGFFGQSTNKSQLGKYFGINNTNTITLQRGRNPLQLTTLDGTFDVGYIIHDNAYAPAAHAATSLATLTLNPQSTHYGVDFVYYQDLSKVIKGAYFKINLPVECVQNNPKFKVTGGATTGLATNANIYSFFQGGTIAGQTATDLQSALTAGKISGKRSATGISDIDLMIGCNFIKKETSHVGVNIGFNIPTGKKSTGAYLFEPVYGTQSFGFGGGIEGSKRFLGNEKHNLKINFAADYRYLFKGSEKRILGLGADNFGQYELIATRLDNVSTANPIPLFPAANLLNQSVNVTPGSQIQGIIGFAYNYRGFTIDLGYNLYGRESELVKAKGTVIPPVNEYTRVTIATQATAGTYGTASKGLIATTGYTSEVGAVGPSSSGGAFGSLPTQFDTAGAASQPWLVPGDVVTGVAATPSQFTNSIYAGIGWAAKEWRCPLMVGIGGKYEFASKNSVLEVWQIDAKLGVSF